MCGSASTDPIATPLEAEAFALRDAVQKIKQHGYEQVAFCIDSEILRSALTKFLRGQSGGSNQQVIGYVENIAHIAVGLDFHFYIVPRHVVNVADTLAKKLRLRCSGYVIKWGFV